MDSYSGRHWQSRFSGQNNFFSKSNRIHFRIHFAIPAQDNQKSYA